MTKPKIYNLIPMTADRLKALQALVRHGKPTAADADALGALWPTLVAMSLAERLPRTERERGTASRYQPTPAGLALCGGASGARTDQP